MAKLPSFRPCARLLALSILLANPAVRAQDDAARERESAGSTTVTAEEPEQVSGVEREPRGPFDTGRTVADWFLLIPRGAVELGFIATGTAAGLMEDEQVVPRVHDLFNPRSGQISVFPTLFMETGTDLNAGGRMIARSGPLATSVRVGYGGVRSLVAESRVRYHAAHWLPEVFTLESFHAATSGVSFLGLGQDPANDPRNHFLGSARKGLYDVRQERYIFSYGVRPIEHGEFLLSSSLNQRHLSNGAGTDRMRAVFELRDYDDALRVSRIVYSEASLRYDTRRTRGGPSPGYLAEVYAGYGGELGKTQSTRFAKTGGRLASFTRFGRTAGVLSPKIVVDTISPVGDTNVPFILLPSQSDFRGFNNRRDYVSLVGSLDYRWALARFFAARLFADIATVAPNTRELTLNGLRYAGGVGVDIFSRSTPLGSIATSFSPEGMRLLLRIGLAPTFGDRQHK